MFRRKPRPAAARRNEEQLDKYSRDASRLGRHISWHGAATATAWHDRIEGAISRLNAETRALHDEVEALIAALSEEDLLYLSPPPAPLASRRGGHGR